MIYDKCVPCRGSVFRQIRGAQRKRLSVFAVFKVPTRLKTIKMPKWHLLRWYILLPSVSWRPGLYPWGSNVHF